jgi:hypothetical protein
VREAQERLAAERNELAATVARVDAEAREIAGMFRGQSEALAAAVRAAAEETRLAIAAERKDARDGFLRTSRGVREELGSLALDLGRALAHEPTAKDMRRYREGDRTIFVRNMLGFRDAGLPAQIKAKYDASAEFRRQVDFYVGHFQGLIADADRVEGDGLLSATFLTSDVGKLYMVLARAVGRLG